MNENLNKDGQLTVHIVGYESLGNGVRLNYDEHGNISNPSIKIKLDYPRS